jgi:uncharacterized protein
LFEQLAVFVAGFLTAITGFGFNAISLPLLAVVFEPHHAVVVGLLVGLVIFLLVFMLPGVRHHVDAHLVWTLFGWSLPGLPLGAVILLWLDARTLRLVIGGLILAYAVGQLSGLLRVGHATRRAAPLVGLISGTLSSSLSMGGTPVILYLIALGGAPRDLRATAVAYVILSTIASLLALYWAGLVDSVALQDAAALAPASVIGFGCGAIAFRYVGRTVFARLTLGILAAVSLFAIAAGLRST